MSCSFRGMHSKISPIRLSVPCGVSQSRSKVSSDLISDLGDYLKCVDCNSEILVSLLLFSDTSNIRMPDFGNPLANPYLPELNDGCVSTARTPTIHSIGGGIFRILMSKLFFVSIRPSCWKDEWPSWVQIDQIHGCRRAQYVADALYYYTGSPPHHFKDANLRFPTLLCIGREISTPEPLSTWEMCSNYVQHIAQGDDYEPQRADFIQKVKDVVNSTDFVLQRERFLNSTEVARKISTEVAKAGSSKMAWLRERNEYERSLKRTLKKHWEPALKCLKKVESMTSVQFNHGLCKELSLKLESAIEMAHAGIYLRSELLETYRQGFILLCRLAKEVENFKCHCCSDDWIRAALMLTDVTEHVSLLSMDLDFCQGILSGIAFGTSAVHGREIILASLKGLIGERQNEVERIRILARLDHENLLKRVTAECQSECQLAAYLLGRLTVALSVSILGSVESSSMSFLEVDYDSLEHQEHLGSGAAGDVHKTVWRGKEFAEKVFYGSDHPTFKNEVSILAGLSHPNIVHMFFHAMDNRSCSIVMELMEEDLFRLMQRRLRQDSMLEFPFIISEAVEIICQVAEGMKYLHENKIVHRDLKSQNILVKTDKGDQMEYVYAKVGDFGLSKTKESSITFSNQSSNIGTMRWMAPELMQDPGIASPSKSETVEKHPFKSDVYSFGMVCYEILTGEVPFQTTRCSSEVRSMVLGGERPTLPSQCPVVLRSLIRRCWDSNASARPRFDDICAELRYLKCLLFTNREEHRSWTEMNEVLKTCTRCLSKRRDYRQVSF